MENKAFIADYSGRNKSVFITVMLQVFVPQGCACYSSTQFACLSEFQHWQAALSPAREAITMLFLGVHGVKVQDIQTTPAAENTGGV